MGTLRKLRRGVAHASMKKEGLTKVNKRSYTGEPFAREIIGSYFSNHWKDYIKK